MPTPLGFPDPPDSTRLALVFNWMRQLANAIDTYLRGQSRTGTAPLNFSNTQAAAVTVNHGLGVIPSFATAIIKDNAARATFTSQVATITASTVTFNFTYRLAQNVTFSSEVMWMVQR